MPRLMAVLYDPVLGLAERRGLSAWRREVLAGLEGRVLEVGAGTGLNLPHYPSTVTSLVLAEPDAHMRHNLERRLARAPRPETSISDAGAGSLPFARGAFDAVVMTLVLCTVDDVASALAEARRVLAPRGVLAFLEHVGGPPGSRRLQWQRRVEPAWRRVAGNCHLTRHTVEAIGAAGFRLRWIRWDDLPGPLRLGSPVVRGVADRGADGRPGMISDSAQRIDTAPPPTGDDARGRDASHNHFVPAGYFLSPAFLQPATHLAKQPPWKRLAVRTPMQLTRCRSIV